MPLDRRSFLAAAAGGLMTSCSPLRGRSTTPEALADAVPPPKRPLLGGSCPFGRRATEQGLETMLGGGSALDGVEQGIRLIESLGSDRSVGLRGRPNAAGYVQLDACIMNGPGHQAGSVAAMEGIAHPITAARRVMEHSKHVMLVGDGARWFALEQGLESVDVSSHAAMKEAWAAGNRPAKAGEGAGHDTIALLALDANGDLAGGCSTSGAGNKLPGRVGDSPILGSGLYVDNDVGAAGATGLGENVMRYAACAMIVEQMRHGLDPTAACEAVVRRIAQRDPLGSKLSISFIALDKQGRFGAATSNGRFPFAVTSRETSEVRRVQRVTPD